MSTTLEDRGAGSSVPIKDSVGLDRSLPDAEVLIPEAHRHHRRRRLRVGAATVFLGVLGLVLGLVFGGSGGGRFHSIGASESPLVLGRGRIEAPRAVFVENPFMGIACGLPDSVPCDRGGLGIGLGVSLRRPAVVTATIDGLALRLNDPHWSEVFLSGSQPTFHYAGLLEPLDTTRMPVPRCYLTQVCGGAEYLAPSVWFRIDFGHGTVVLVHDHVVLGPGWS